METEEDNEVEANETTFQFKGEWGQGGGGWIEEEASSNKIITWGSPRVVGVVLLMKQGVACSTHFSTHGVAFMLPETVCRKYLGRAYVDEMG